MGVENLSQDNQDQDKKVNYDELLTDAQREAAQESPLVTNVDAARLEANTQEVANGLKSLGAEQIADVDSDQHRVGASNLSSGESLQRLIDTGNLSSEPGKAGNDEDVAAARRGLDRINAEHAE